MPESAATTAIVVRPAEAADLAPAARVYRHADADHAGQCDDSPEATAIEAAALADLSLLAAGPGDPVWVAQEGNRIVGVAAAALRGRHWHLAYLFVEPDRQGEGIGRRLLQACHQAGIDTGCTVFTTEPSSDPRGLASYLGLGMMPARPAVRYESESGQFAEADWRDALEVVPVSPTDDHLLATVGDIDAAVRGARRESDHQVWLAGGAALCLLIDRPTAVPAGYFVLRPDGAGWHVGPVAAMNADRFDMVLARALAAAGAANENGNGPWRAIAPGENRAAHQVLATAGFRPVALIPLLASGPVGLWDRYLFADLDVL
jgi:GNAT superfamily N-acetyltransferase